jgi:predicted Zn finger-like uncharacterized protein
MIIECERCRSKFKLDDALLKQGGSRVRCSICKNIFKAYPPEPEPVDITATGGMEMEETVALDSPPVLADREDIASEGIQRGEVDQIPPEETMERAPAPSAGTPGEAAQALESAGAPEELSRPEPEDLEGRPIHEEEISLEGRPRAQEKKAFRPFFLILVLVVILLAGSAAVYLFAPEVLPDSLSFLKPPQKQELADPGVARLSLGNVKGGFVQSGPDSQLFVIQGVVTNNYPKPRSYILVKGSLLDDKGQTVKTKMAYAGNTFSEEQLKTMPIEEVNKELKNRSGRQGANVGVKPEAGVQFSIVIESLPENLSEFTVEAVSSSPEQP